jgi:hypothetical protein
MFGHAVELSRFHVRLELTIPCPGVKGCEPLPEPHKLVGREFMHVPFDLLYFVHEPHFPGAKAQTLD